MRRPAPLPTPAEQETAPRPRPKGRPAARERAVEPVGDPVIEPVVGTDETSPEPDVDGGGSAPMTSRDVWRAARARRKALRAEIRRFTQRSRRRRVIWLSAIGAVLLLIGGSAATAYSPLFAVERITVVGASALDPVAVETALSGQIGTPLALVDGGEVKAALLAFPLIETYALEARPPHDLTVRIVERTPVGVVASDAGFTLVDAAGVALSTTAEQPAGQPVLEVEGGIDSAVFRAVGLVVRSLPADVRGMLTTVRASTEDDVTLTLSSGLTVVWGNADRSPAKAAALTGALKAKPDAKTVDVSSPQSAVVG